jgi:hypothetical protein
MVARMAFIDLATENLITDDDVRQRFMPTIVNRLDDIAAEDLAGVGVGVVTIVETAAPQASYTHEVVDVGYVKNNGVWTQQWDVVPPSLNDAKIFALSTAQNAYETAKLMAVAAAGTTWRGGFESAQGIDGVVRLAEFAGAPMVTIYDAESNPHEKTLLEAKQIALAVGVAYQVVYGKLSGMRRAIAAAESVEAVLAVTWD